MPIWDEVLKTFFLLKRVIALKRTKNKKNTKAQSSPQEELWKQNQKRSQWKTIAHCEMKLQRFLKNRKLTLLMAPKGLGDLLQGEAETVLQLGKDLIGWNMMCIKNGWIPCLPQSINYIDENRRHIFFTSCVTTYRKSMPERKSRAINGMLSACSLKKPMP